MDAYSPEDSFLINSLPLNANQFEAGSEALNSVPSILVWNTELNVFQRINTKTNEVLNQFNSNQEYKVYTALLTQSGTDAPVATVLSNTIGEVPVWDYDSVGYVTLTKTGGFDETKTFVNVGTAYNQSKSGPGFRTYVFTDNKIWIDQYEIILGLQTPSNGVLFYTPFEIRVYP